MVTFDQIMDVILKEFSELKPGQLEQILRLRQQVFIIEQTCFYEDIDGDDDKADHLMFYKGETLAAYLRIFLPGTKYDKEASLGRIVVAPGFRSTGLGPQLIRKGIESCKGAPVRIEAQAALIKYYQELGFEPEGKVYVVDDIDHIQMTLSQ